MIPDVYDVLLGLSEGRYTLEQAFCWIEIHVNDRKDEQQFQEQQRRRDMYEKVALALLTTIDNISCEGIAKYAEMFLEGADKFAKGEK